MSNDAANIQQYHITLLVVDDNGELNRFFCHFFHLLGLHVLSASSYTEACEILALDYDIDILLIDHDLGDGEGFNLLNRLKKTEMTRMQAIMISSIDDATFIQRCFDAGASDYVAKPVHLHLLRLKVESLLETTILHKKLLRQNSELERWLKFTEHEKDVARFTFDKLLENHHEPLDAVEAFSRPCSSLNGDFVMCRRAPNGNIFCILADATGHGLAATICIMPVVTVFGTMVGKGFGLAQIVLEINRKLLAETSIDKFVAALVVEVDLTRAVLSVWNGGLPTAFWMDDHGQQLHSFASRHMALGILDDEEFDVHTQTIPLPAEGYFFACTDGVIEQRDTAGKSFGKQGLQDVLGRGNSDALIKTLMETLTVHAGRENFDDDVSVCVMAARKLQRLRRQDDSRSWLRGLETVSPFSWHIRLCGQHLSRHALPAKVNHYLQTLGLPEGLCKTIFTVISELVSNALDHGILRLDSQIKDRAEGFMEYIELRQQQLVRLTDTDYIELGIQLEQLAWGSQLQIEVCDSGPGYDMENSIDMHDQPTYYGRGLDLVSRLFDELEILPPGNIARARINLLGEPCG